MFLKVTPLQMEKHNVILAKLKSEVVQAHDEVLKLKGAVPKGMIWYLWINHYVMMSNVFT